MKLIQLNIEGAYAPKCVRPTYELSNGESVVLGYCADTDLATAFTKDFQRFVTDADLPDTVPDDLGLLQSAMDLCFSDFNLNCTIRGDLTRVEYTENGEQIVLTPFSPIPDIFKPLLQPVWTADFKLKFYQSLSEET
jgi:hypothetical protein